MNLAATISLYGGGPGSGCVGSNCGRPESLTEPYLKGTKAFIEPPAPSERGVAALDHYVVEKDGTVKRVLTHLDYFVKTKQNLPEFLRNGGITVTVSAGGPGILFGRKTAATVDRVLQIAGHPMFRDHGATVEFMTPGEGNAWKPVEFNGTVGNLSRAMRPWVEQRRAA
jgi:hypothetical protein